MDAWLDRKETEYAGVKLSGYTFEADTAACCVGFLYGSLYNMQELFCNWQKEKAREKTRKKIEQL